MPFERLSGRTAVLSVAALLGAIAFGAALTRTEAQSPTTAVTPTVASRTHGKAIYDARCVECHGASGRGDGPAAMLLNPRPRDFTSGKFKLRTTAMDSVPTDDDLIATVRQGMHGTSMPGWDGLLSPTDIRDVVEYVKTFSPQFAGEPPKPVAIGTPVASSPASIARGQPVYEKLQCSGCHGTDGRGAGAIATEFEDDWGQPLRATDLTEPWTFRGGPTARDIYVRIRTGLTGTPMPSFADAATDAEAWDVANYVVSLGRPPLWSKSAEDIAAAYAREEADAKAEPAKRGRYLVDTLACAVCHSPTDENRRILPGLKMAGGMVLRIEPFGDYPTGNLTSDKETGLGAWTDDEIKRVLTRGILRDGTRLLPYPMEWPSFSYLKPDDLSAIVAYLRTIPPVSNKVPPPTRPFLPTYLWGKFRMLVLGQDPPMKFYPGNAGSAKGGRS